MVNTVSEIYLPWNWVDLAIIAEQGTDVSATIMNECDFNKLNHTLTTMISWEGLSELASRVVGALPFEFPKIWDKINNGGNDFTTFEGIGEFLQATLDYSIS